MMKAEMIQNVRATVGRIFLSPQYQEKVKTYNDSIEMVYQMVNSSYTDYHWIMTMKQVKPAGDPPSADTFYFNCFDCFTTVDPSGQYLFLIAGVLRGLTPNTNYVEQMAFRSEMKLYGTAQDMANGIFNGYCLAGIEAVSMYEDLEDIFPLEWNGVSKRTDDPDGQFTIRFWSYEEDCRLYFTENAV